jgi:hypothetical protein
MQLTTGSRTPALRARLSAAACMLLASGMPAAAGTDSGSSSQLDLSTLLYAEKHRTNVVEPAVRLTRTFADGQSLAAQFEFDAVTGASPSGGSPSLTVQTVSGASGSVRTVAAGQIPTRSYADKRYAADLEWQKPFLRSFVSTLGGHFSRERDYQSAGVSGKLSLDVLQRRTTFTLGGALDRDRVFPDGGIPVGLTDANAPTPTSGDDGGEGGEREGGEDGAGARDGRSKGVASAMAGISQVVNRRWLLGVNATRTLERGYLTEPYKVVSVVDPATGEPTALLTEKRPDRRTRTSILGSSVYHLTEDVLYVSYRYYWDDWRVRSHTIDFKYRRELGGDKYLEPHLRFYSQGAADFFRYSLVGGTPLPRYATADSRLGDLRSLTAGATVGFHLPGSTGEWTVRAEYIAQLGRGHPADAVGIQRDFDLAPRVDIGSLLIGYSVGF